MLNLLEDSLLPYNMIVNLASKVLLLSSVISDENLVMKENIEENPSIVELGELDDVVTLNQYQSRIKEVLVRQNHSPLVASHKKNKEWKWRYSEINVF